MCACHYKRGDGSGCSDGHCSENYWVCLTRKIVKGVCLPLQEGGDWSGCSDAHCSENNWVCLTKKIFKGVHYKGGMGVGVGMRIVQKIIGCALLGK